MTPAATIGKRRVSVALVIALRDLGAVLFFHASTTNEGNAR